MKDYAKIPAFQTLLNVIEMPEVKVSMLKAGAEEPGFNYRLQLFVVESYQTHDES